MAGFQCTDARNIPYRGTLAPPAFKPVYYRGNAVPSGIYGLYVPLRGLT